MKALESRECIFSQKKDFTARALSHCYPQVQTWRDSRQMETNQSSASIWIAHDVTFCEKWELEQGNAHIFGFAAAAEDKKRAKTMYVSTFFTAFLSWRSEAVLMVKKWSIPGMSQQIQRGHKHSCYSTRSKRYFQPFPRKYMDLKSVGLMSLIYIRIYQTRILGQNFKENILFLSRIYGFHNVSIAPKNALHPKIEVVISPLQLPWPHSWHNDGPISQELAAPY